MNRDEILVLVDRKIREHEIRVAIISGLIGGVIIAGIFHAIWLNRIQ
jgi:hypothetical protein